MNKLLFIFLMPCLAYAQTTVNQASNQDANSALLAGQSNLLGTNIGQQVNNTPTTINGGSGNTNLTTNASDTTTIKNINVPNITAPYLTAGGTDICLGSVSGGFSMLGYGIAGGKTVVDENCVMLKNSARLKDLGFGNAAFSMLMENQKIALSIRDSSPLVYQQIVKNKVDNLKAEIEIAKQEGDDISNIENELKKYMREYKIIASRIKASPELQVKEVPPNVNTN